MNKDLNYYADLLYTNSTFRKLVEDYIVDLEYREIKNLSEEELKEKIRYGDFNIAIDEWEDWDLIDCVHSKTLKELENKLEK